MKNDQSRRFENPILPDQSSNQILTFGLSESYPKSYGEFLENSFFFDKFCPKRFSGFLSISEFSESLNTGCVKNDQSRRRENPILLDQSTNQFLRRYGITSYGITKSVPYL